MKSTYSQLLDSLKAAESSLDSTVRIASQITAQKDIETGRLLALLDNARIDIQQLRKLRTTVHQLIHTHNLLNH